MVKVPSSFVPNVDMQVGSPTFMQAQSPQAMQSSAGQQLQQFGQGLAAFGEGVNRYASALDDAANEANVRKLDLELYDDIVKEVDTFEQTQFDQSRTEAPKVLERIEQKRKQLMERVENQQQSDMLTSTLNRRVQSASAAVERHTGKQTFEFNKFQASKRAASFFDAASRDIEGWRTIDDAESTSEYREQVETAIDEVRAAHPGIPQFAPDGTTNPAWSALLQNYTSKMVGQAVNRFVKDNSPEALNEARDYVEDSAKRGFISEEARQSFLGTVNNQLQERDAAVKAGELLDKNPKWNAEDVVSYFDEQLRSNAMTADEVERLQRRTLLTQKAREEVETKQNVALINWARNVMMQPVAQEGLPGGVYDISLRPAEEIRSFLQQSSATQYADLEKRGLLNVAIADAQGKLDREDPAETVRLNNLIYRNALKSAFPSREALEQHLLGRQTKSQADRALAAWDAENGDMAAALQMKAKDKLAQTYQELTTKDPFDKVNEADFKAWERKVQLAYINWQQQNRTDKNPNPTATDSQLLQIIIPEAMSTVKIDEWGFDTEMSYSEMLASGDQAKIQNAYVQGSGSKVIYLREMPMDVRAEVIKNYIGQGGGSRASITAIYQYWDRIGRPLTREATVRAIATPPPSQSQQDISEAIRQMSRLPEMKR